MEQKNNQSIDRRKTIHTCNKFSCNFWWWVKKKIFFFYFFIIFYYFYFFYYFFINLIFFFKSDFLLRGKVKMVLYENKKEKRMIEHSKTPNLRKYQHKVEDLEKGVLRWNNFLFCFVFFFFLAFFNFFDLYFFRYEWNLVPKVKWLDALSFDQIEHIREKNYKCGKYSSLTLHFPMFTNCKNKKFLKLKNNKKKKN